MAAAPAFLTGWWCLDCEVAGTGPTSDKDAEKHTRSTMHGTSVRTVPVQYVQLLERTPTDA